MMFYTQLFASKRGPLAKIWLAAHWERKITKAQVFECNLETTIEDIISPLMRIGLRTSSHLLLGVVRIYSRKAKYLLADCNDALVKIKVAFRPGQTQTDMPAEALEATTKAITLVEEFTDFDTLLPSNIDLLENYALNQSRKEEITLKEDFGNSFLILQEFGGESHRPLGLLDMTFQSLADPQDNFGDEDIGMDVLDWITSSSDNAFQEDNITQEPPNELLETSTNIINEEPMELDAPRPDPMEAELSTMSETTLVANKEEGMSETTLVANEEEGMSETTLVANEEEGFALEPVTMTPTSDRKRLRRKRKLVVDQDKELSNEAIRKHIADYSDLIGPLDMAPPTYKLMKWKETGQADKLLSRFTADVIHPQLMKLFPNIISGARVIRVSDEDEHRAGGQKEGSLHTAELSALDQTVDSERLRPSAELTPPEHVSDPPENCIEPAQDENGLDFSHSGLPSEDSMFVHPSGRNRESQSTIIPTQSELDSQDREERRLTRKTQKLLNTLRNLSSGSSNATVSFKSLCARSSRARASSTFFYLLVLKKRQAIELHQKAPYEDVLATPGPKFHES